jgi:outer membrane protein OmpA-like peptidoglycan-associated protein
MRGFLGTAVLAALAALIFGTSAHAQPMSIFFDFEVSQVTPTAGKLVEIAKDRLKTLSRVTIAGHADTAEADADKLSLTRALEVEKALIAMGVPGGVSFTIVGKGATDLRVKTGANVREPQNRRVTVEIK